MIQIRARDYFQLDYDASAQNRISSLNGKNYVRTQATQSVTKTVNKAKLVATGQEIQLPYKVIIHSIEDDYPDVEGEYIFVGREYFEEGRQSEPLLPGFKDKEGYIRFFQQAVGTSSTANQYALYADLEVLFTDLNMPVGYTPEVKINYDLEHFKYGGDELISDKYAEYRAMRDKLKAEGVQSGAFINKDWFNLWIGVALAPTEDRRVSFSDNHMYFNEMRKSYAFSVSTNYRGYLGTQYEEDVPVSVRQVAEGFYLSVLNDIVRTGRMDAGQYFKGGYIGLSVVEQTLVDRDTYKVRLRIPIYNALVTNLKPDSSAVKHMDYANAYEWLKSVSVTLTYPKAVWDGENFDFKAEGVSDLYPYRFQNTQVANKGDTVQGQAWSDYYPKMLLDKYKESKHYVTVHVSARFMLENDIEIDTPVQIYDLKNKIISRSGIPCTFKVKRIVKSFSNNEYRYILNCLEE